MNVFHSAMFVVVVRRVRSECRLSHNFSLCAKTHLIALTPIRFDAMKNRTAQRVVVWSFVHSVGEMNGRPFKRVNAEHGEPICCLWRSLTLRWFFSHLHLIRWHSVISTCCTAAAQCAPILAIFRSRRYRSLICKAKRKSISAGKWQKPTTHLIEDECTRHAHRTAGSIK